MTTTHDEHVQMIQDCELRSEKLTNWETDFIDSLSSQVVSGRTLTERQIEKLEAIWDRIT